MNNVTLINYRPLRQSVRSGQSSAAIECNLQDLSYKSKLGLRHRVSLLSYQQFTDNALYMCRCEVVEHVGAVSPLDRDGRGAARAPRAAQPHPSPDGTHTRYVAYMFVLESIREFKCVSLFSLGLGQQVSV